MATYKVIQDIEAEDKLVGPLSLRQFIYAGICIVCLYICFLLVTKGLAFGVVLFLPPAFLFGFLAFPWGGEQPTEVWALAKVNFMVKPRRRIWNQSGVKELVTVTAPKTVEVTYTNGLSQTEVKSRLKALADTIDSRGWVIKNVNGPMYGQLATAQNDQRLVGITTAIPEVEQFVADPSEDVFDAQNNPVAQKFDTMIAANEKTHRQELVDRMNAPDLPAPPASVQAVPAAQAQAPAGNDYWFLNQPMQSGATVPQDTVTFNTQVVAPGAPVSALPVAAAAPTPDEEAFIKHLKAEPVISPNLGHLHVIQPLSAQQNAVPQPQQQYAQQSRVVSAGPPQQQPQDTMAAAQQNPAPPMDQPQVTPAPDAAILDLARNDDLNVATIAREAQKRKDLPDEVVISLH